MTGETPARAEDIFEVANDLPPDERTIFLDAACRDDPLLRSEVDSLLAAGEHATGWIDELSARLGLSELHDEAPEPPPDSLFGPYRLLRRIGRGGMGAVYLAERADEHFEKRVAVKILPVGLRDGEMRRRFLAERQILAGLTHPHIATLLDGGITEDGTPYFVMEHVDGWPIDEYCDLRHLNVEARLDLFQQVCEAVSYAHRSLVVHRDLKPPNVLVDDTGQVKLLDFGIAKALDAESEQTQIGVRPMTPRYAAPELLQDGPVTTAADVYSLGVLLYELLVGVSPYGRRRADESELRRLVCEEDVSPPSHMVSRHDDPTADDAMTRAEQRDSTPGLLRDRLQGDLDTIVGMALHKNREHRYRSVDDLAADLSRHRRHLPVTARPPTLGYRSRKFVRRHRTPVIASLLAALFAVTAGVLGVLHVATTRQQARLIAVERDRAEQISAFLVETFLSSDPNVSQGASITARELLDRGAARIDEELAGQPRTQAQMMATMADVYLTLALYDEARPLLERARSLHEEMGTTHTPEFADVVQQLGLMEEQTGHYDLARTLAERAIELRKASGDQESLAHATLLLGRIHQRQGDLATAAIHLEEAVRLQRQHLGPDTEPVALGLNNLATLHQQQGDLETAERMHREALRIRRALNDGEHLKLIESLYNLGVVTRRQGRLDEAQAYYEEALEITARLVPDGYADDAYTHNGLGFVHMDRGELDEAAARFARSIEISRHFLGDRHPNVGIVLASLGHVHLLQDRLGEARPMLEESLSILLETVPDHPRIASVREDLVSCGGAAEGPN